jgi:hypothetical protein
VLPLQAQERVPREPVWPLLAPRVLLARVLLARVLPQAEEEGAAVALLFAPEHSKPTASPPAKSTTDLPVSFFLVFPRLRAARVTL